MINWNNKLTRGNHAFLSIIFFLLLLFISPPAFSSPNTSIKFSPGISFFNYQEFDSQSKRLNRERGSLYGFSSEVSYQGHKYHPAGSVSFLSGKVDYVGKTNKGRNGGTDTSELIIDINTSISSEFVRTRLYSLSAKMYLGYRNWKRDIQSTTLAIGPLEYYRWYYVSAGYSISKVIDYQFQLNSELMIMASPYSEIEFNFPGYDKAIANLGFTRGVKFKLDLLNKQSQFGLNFSYDLWLIARNEAVSLYKNGTKSNLLLTEPKSITQTFGVGVSYKF